MTENPFHCAILSDLDVYELRVTKNNIQLLLDFHYSLLLENQKQALDGIIEYIIGEGFIDQLGRVPILHHPLASDTSSNTELSPLVHFC